ncbi:hypothetical protein ATK36_4831 [Amycolatopsis sulphurea]|uniref:Uncharacterized protein n=1 Tax=Amycolatopsis sulphurea TaxID=76022 RepID=A0A2A9FDY9_9PSEU|nr:hypothetical protein ATK36_4831 [Amycolatopsis sulphurea]
MKARGREVDPVEFGRTAEGFPHGRCLRWPVHEHQPATAVDKDLAKSKS